MHRPDRILADGGGEVNPLEEAARVHHAQDREEDQHQDRHDQVVDLALLGDIKALVLVDGRRCGLLDIGLLGHDRLQVRMVVGIGFRLIGKAHRGQLLQQLAALGSSALGGLRLRLGGAHRTVIVLVRDQHEEHEEDGEQRVEVVRDGLHERGEAVVSQVTAHRNGPRGHRRNDADRGCRGVDDPGQLLMADVEAIGHGAHDRADRQAVEVVVDEDDDAQQAGEHLRGARVLDMGGHPLGISAAAARRGNDHGQRAQQRKE